MKLEMGNYLYDVRVSDIVIAMNEEACSYISDAVVIAYTIN